MHHLFRSIALVALSAIAPHLSFGQLVANPQAIPRTGNPPVVFVNGYETNCSGVSFSGEFGIADQVLQAVNRASLFFNTCSVAGKPLIETLGTAFGAWLATLTYADGTPVTSVDVVAYSMGGLVVRSYLSGKQTTAGLFSPPPSIPIRKAVFIATPNFGTPVASLAFGLNAQTTEMASGSQFLMELNTWNQAHDDLHGVDAIAMIGNGGTGLATTSGFDDGLVPLSSGSLGFYLPGRTRILALCHQAFPATLTLTGFCAPSAKGIAQLLAASDDNAKIVTSFLSSAADWQAIGTAAEQNPFLQTGGGIIVQARTAADVLVNATSITATTASGPQKALNLSNGLGYTDLIAAGGVNLAIVGPSFSLGTTLTVVKGGAQALVAKAGPDVAAVVPSAAPVFPLVVTPRMIVSIYGTGLAQGAAQSTFLPLPTTLSDATVNLNGTPVGLLYVSPGQINAVLPDKISGLNSLQIQTSVGLQTINIWIEPAFPAVFTIANGYAAAVNAGSAAIASATTPFHAGDYMELFLTGLGSTAVQGGLDYAIAQPTVTIGGVNCPVTYAGAAPSFIGLDQINCRIPAGLGTQMAAQVVVQSGLRSSPPTIIATQ
jgi:uncharacterized protein (TIGR03437 family)